MATLTATSALRQEEIELQVLIISPIMNVNGFASPEAKAATERARVLIEEAEALGEPPENPLMLYSVLYGAWATNVVAFNGDALLTLAKQFLTLAERQRAAVPIMIGHGIMGYSFLTTGSLAQAKIHSDHAIALYDPAYRPLAMLFGLDVRVNIVGQRSYASLLLGYPEAALADANQSLKEARDIGQATFLFMALSNVFVIHFFCGNYATAEMLADELFTLADEQGAAPWKLAGLAYRGWILAVAGRASEAVQLMSPALAAFRGAGATFMRSPEHGAALA
jgi:hypothetical protein